MAGPGAGEQALARRRSPPTLDSYDLPRSSRPCPDPVDLITKNRALRSQDETCRFLHAGADNDIHTGPSVQRVPGSLPGMPPEHLVHWHPRGR